MLNALYLISTYNKAHQPLSDSSLSEIENDATCFTLLCSKENFNTLFSQWMEVDMKEIYLLSYGMKAFPFFEDYQDHTNISRKGFKCGSKVKLIETNCKGMNCKSIILETLQWQKCLCCRLLQSLSYLSMIPVY